MNRDDHLIALSCLDGAASQIRAAVSAHPVLSRWLLACPGAAVASLLFVMAMPVWLPKGVAGVDHVVWPQVLAPSVWSIFCVYACLEDELLRGVAIITGVILVCGCLSGLAILGWVWW